MNSLGRGWSDCKTSWLFQIKQKTQLKKSNLCNIFSNFFITVLVGLQLLPHNIFYLM